MNTYPAFPLRKAGYVFIPVKFRQVPSSSVKFVFGHFRPIWVRGGARAPAGGAPGASGQPAEPPGPGRGGASQPSPASQPSQASQASPARPGRASPAYPLPLYPLSPVSLSPYPNPYAPTLCCLQHRRSSLSQYLRLHLYSCWSWQHLSVQGMVLSL